MSALASKIVHQTQPTDSSCTATCIAMALGLPVAALEVPLGNALNFDDFGVYLAERGVWMRRCIRIDEAGERLQQERLYLVGVRSLNVMAGDHAILLDTRAADIDHENPRKHWQLFDPNKGFPDKEVYEAIGEPWIVDFVELRDRSASGCIAVGRPPL